MKRNFLSCYMYFDGDIKQPYRRRLVEIKTDNELKQITQSILDTLENIKENHNGYWVDFLDECINKTLGFIVGCESDVWVEYGSREFGLKLVEIEVVKESNWIELIEFEEM